MKTTTNSLPLLAMIMAIALFNVLNIRAQNNRGESLFSKNSLVGSLAGIDSTINHLEIPSVKPITKSTQEDNGIVGYWTVLSSKDKEGNSYYAEGEVVIIFFSNHTYQVYNYIDGFFPSANWWYASPNTIQDSRGFTLYIQDMTENSATIYEALTEAPSEIYGVHQLKRYNKLLLGLSYQSGYFKTQIAETSIKGIAADGASSLKVTAKNIPASVAFQKVTLTSDYGNEQATCGYVSNLRIESSDRAEMEYYAPTEYPIDAPDMYEVDMTVVFYDANQRELDRASKKIQIVRPPVLMVHGLNDSKMLFFDLEQQLWKSGKYREFQTLRADYSTTNKAPFTENLHVVQKGLTTLFGWYQQKGIVASKADIIGHSMGGILGRLHVQYVSNKDIHKLITVNTPHSGSQGANLIMGNKAAWTVAWYLFDRTFDAISDLQVNNPTIDNYLNHSGVLSKMNGIPIHAIATTANLGEIEKEFTTELASNGLLDKATKGRGYPYFCLLKAGLLTALQWGGKPNLTFTDFVSDLYGGDSDLVVSEQSQYGGLDYPCISYLGNNRVDYFHCNTPYLQDVKQRIFELLLLQSSNPSFSKGGFRPPKLSYDYQQAQQPTPIIATRGVENETIKVEATLKGDHSEIRAKILKNNIPSFMAYAVYEDGAMFASEKNEFAIPIPDKYEGEVKIYALGLCSRENEFVQDSLSISVNRIANETPVSIRFDVNERYDICVGETIRPRVIATWADGSETVVRNTMLRITDTCADMQDSYVKGVKEGECNIEAAFKGLNCEVPVNVYSNTIFEHIDTGNSFNVVSGTNDNATIEVWNGTTKISDTTQIENGTTVTITVTPKAGYAVEKLFANGEELSGNLLTVESNVLIKATLSKVTAIEEEKEAAIKVYGSDNVVIIEGAAGRKASVIDITGVVIVQPTMLTGAPTRFVLPQGIYVVSVDGRNCKVAVK